MKRLAAVLVLVAAGGVWWALRPSGFQTDAPLRFSGGEIDLLADLDTDSLPEGWVHRTFLTVPQADYAMTEEDTLRCRTDGSGSILVRDTQIALSDLPMLSWDWQITQPIESDLDEDTKDGDDHPARFFVVFSNDDGARKAMEIIWSNVKYAPGDYKIIGEFYHYVANGLPENAGTWHAQRVDLRRIYSDIGGTGTPTLDAIGFFCDSDNTGTRSEAFFRNVALAAGDS